VFWRRRTHPAQPLFGGIADGGLQGVETRRQAHHTIVRGAAVAGADGDGRGVEPVVEAFDQRRDKVLADLDGNLDAVLSVKPGARPSAGARVW